MSACTTSVSLILSVICNGTKSPGQNIQPRLESNKVLYAITHLEVLILKFIVSVKAGNTTYHQRITNVCSKHFNLANFRFTALISLCQL